MEQELRNKVKDAAKEYYKEVFGKKREFDYIPPSGKLLGEEELLKYHKKIILRAEVKKNNMASICVFKKLNYDEIGNDNQINVFEKKISR